jgi:hypothetical protein
MVKAAADQLSSAATRKNTLVICLRPNRIGTERRRYHLSLDGIRSWNDEALFEEARAIGLSASGLLDTARIYRSRIGEADETARECLHVLVLTFCATVTHVFQVLPVPRSMITRMKYDESRHKKLAMELQITNPSITPGDVANRLQSWIVSESARRGILFCAVNIFDVKKLESGFEQDRCLIVQVLAKCAEKVITIFPLFASLGSVFLYDDLRSLVEKAKNCPDGKCGFPVVARVGGYQVGAWVLWFKEEEVRDMKAHRGGLDWQNRKIEYFQ